MPEAITRKEFHELREEVEHIKENVAILSNPDLLEKIKEVRMRLANGKGIELEKVTKDILDRYRPLGAQSWGLQNSI